MIIEYEKLEKIDEVINLLDNYIFPKSISNKGELVLSYKGQEEVKVVKNSLKDLRKILYEYCEIKGSFKTFGMPEFEDLIIRLNKEDLETILLNGGFIDLGEKDIIKNILTRYIYDTDEEKKFLDKVNESTKNPIKSICELEYE